LCRKKALRNKGKNFKKRKKKGYPKEKRSPLTRKESEIIKVERHAREKETAA